MVSFCRYFIADSESLKIFYSCTSKKVKKLNLSKPYHAKLEKTKNTITFLKKLEIEKFKFFLGFRPWAIILYHKKSENRILTPFWMTRTLNLFTKFGNKKEIF